VTRRARKRDFRDGSISEFFNTIRRERSFAGTAAKGSIRPKAEVLRLMAQVGFAQIAVSLDDVMDELLGQ
jgi:hypothetical protein